jgi:membrane-bound lytic murein transglycosylase MltF
VPWRLLKAQYWQESRLRPDARSPVGAEGIAQFMPATWSEILRAMGRELVDRRLATPSIEAGAFYMARLRRNWSSPRPWEDRHKLSLASYNAGLGHILAAQRACKMPVFYHEIMACLPEITGKHAAETLGYAPAIWRWWRMMEASR